MSSRRRPRSWMARRRLGPDERITQLESALAHVAEALKQIDARWQRMVAEHEQATAAAAEVTRIFEAALKRYRH